MTALLQSRINLSFAGQEQHVGTKAPPPEIVLENAVMRTEPAIVRVQVRCLNKLQIDDLSSNFFLSIDTSENFDSGQSLLPSSGRG